MHKRKIIYLLAILIAACALRPARGAETSARERFDSLSFLIQKNYLQQGALSLEWADRLLAIAQENPQNGDLRAEALYWKTLVSYSHHSNDACLLHEIDSLLSLPKILNNKKQSYYLWYAAALAKMTYGNFPEAFGAALHAYRLAEEKQEAAFLYQTALMLGNIGPYLQDYQISRYYYDIAAQYLEPCDTVAAFKLAINRSRLYFSEGKTDSAALSLQAYLPYADHIADPMLVATAYLNMGSYLAGLDLRDSAFAYYQAILDLSRETENHNILLATYGNIGNHYSNKGLTDSAMYYYRMARTMALADGNLDQYATLSYDMSLLFTTLGQTDSAYIYLKEYNDLTDRIQRPQTIESYRNYVDMVMRSSDDRIKLSQQAVSLKNKQIILIASILAGIIIAVVLLLLVMMERRRSARQYALLKEIENTELSGQLQHEQEIKKLQEEQMEQKIRELSSYSLLLANKNNVLEKIKDELSRQDADNRIDIAHKISRIIDESIAVDGDYWNTFVIHFTQVNPDFFENLQSRFPQLTPNEVKLCAYIRIGMTSKQIAQMLNLSPDSVIKNRYRLRKKLSLEKEEDLDKIIREI